MNPDGMDYDLYVRMFVERIDADMKTDLIPFDELIEKYK